MSNPLNIINTLIPTARTDAVAIFDDKFVQLFKNARSIKAVVKEQSKVMEHPIETGAIITDHRIILPTEIELSIMIVSADYKDVYKSIKQYFLQGTLLTVRTRSDTYSNQLIVSLPHEEDASLYEALTIALSLKQVVYVSPQYGITPKYPSNSTTASRGIQNATPANAKQTSIMRTTLDGIAKAFSKVIKALFP